MAFYALSFALKGVRVCKVRTHNEGFREAGVFDLGSGNDAQIGHAESGGENRVGTLTRHPIHFAGTSPHRETGVLPLV